MKDTIPFEQFSLRWRFVDPAYNVLPHEVVARIRALGASSSSKCHTEAMKLAPQSTTIDETRYPSITHFKTSEDAEIVRGWLYEHLRNFDQDVTVSWNPETAALVRLKDFCDYWDDFCYPGSDDVVVLPEKKDWVLCYFHEEQFFLGQNAV